MVPQKLNDLKIRYYFLVVKIVRFIKGGGSLKCMSVLATISKTNGRGNFRVVPIEASDAYLDVVKNPNTPIHPEVDATLRKVGFDEVIPTRGVRPIEAMQGDTFDPIYADTYFPKREGTRGVSIHLSPFGYTVMSEPFHPSVGHLIQHPSATTRWPSEGYDAKTALTNVRNIAEGKGHENTLSESLESQLVSRFPELEERIVSALSELGDRIEALKYPGNSFNYVLKVKPENGVPFIFKAYPDAQIRDKEAMILDVLAGHPILSLHVPKRFASGNYAQMPCNVIEDVETLQDSADFRVKIYQSMPMQDKLLGMGHATDLRFLLAVLHHSGAKIADQLPLSMSTLSYWPSDVMGVDMIKAGDLRREFIERCLSLYDELVAQVGDSYETTFIHNDAKSKNVVRQPSQNGVRYLYLIDWERAGVGMIENDLRRATLESESRGEYPARFIATYMSSRHLLSGDNKWLDKGEFRRLYESVRHFGPMDLVRSVYALGKRYMWDTECKNLRDYAIKELEQRLCLQGRK